MSKYDFKAIEKKWQNYWNKEKIFKADDFSKKPKYYILDMFPYPSSFGLHVGHIEGYTATDIICRFKKMNGYNVLHPMGWDAFGLPAEQYALESGIHPKITTKKNIENFKRQIQSHGFGYDWDREINTTDEKYYKWTQWIFIQLYNKGLAYIDEISVNWCPKLGTVLANEEIIDGKSERGRYEVIKKPMKQWLLKITDYAERLLKDLDDLDWPENIKKMQKEWIGKTEGVKIKFYFVDINDYIEIYTTRPDTIFGVAFICLAIGNKIIDKIVNMPNANKIKINEFLNNINLFSKCDIKDKIGVFTGIYVINPINDEIIPVYIANYVILSNGTGSIMSVPAHDIRDFEFAKKYYIKYKNVIVQNNNINNNIECYEGHGVIINSKNSKLGNIDGIDSNLAGKLVIDFLEKNKLGSKHINYKIKDWLFSRQRYWGEPFPIVYDDNNNPKIIPEFELPLLLPNFDIKELKYINNNSVAPLSRIKNWKYYDINSNKLLNIETNTMPQWAGSCWYYLRYLDPDNQNSFCNIDKEKYWMPVDLYIGGSEHAVLHLLYARFWHKVLYDLGLVSTNEPFKKLINQGMILGISYKNKYGNIIPNDMVIQKNNDFYHKDTNEKLISFSSKMSKSLKNVVNPDEIINRFGADSVRLYEMFMGPIQASKLWDTSGITGLYRFLNKIWNIVHEFNIIDTNVNEEQLFLLHNLIKKVTQDTENFNFNTAISSMMIFINDLLKTLKDMILPKEIIVNFIILLSPYAPHICEEIWEYLGNNNSILYSEWPKYKHQYLVKNKIKIPVQICNKLKTVISCELNTNQEDILNIVYKNEKLRKILYQKKIVNIFYIKNRLLNIIIK